MPNPQDAMLMPMFEDPRLVRIHVNDFEEQHDRDIIERFRDANNNEQPVIPIIINSYGGDVASFLLMYDLIKASTKPIATICIGKAMSCGAMLLCCGTKSFRIASPHSDILMHDISGGMAGKGTDMIADAADLKRCSKLLNKIMKEHTGTDFDKLLKTKNNIDMHITPQQAKRLGMIDHIGVADLRICPTPRYEFTIL